MIRALFILPGPSRPESTAGRNRFQYLGKYVTGDVLWPCWPCPDSLAGELEDISPNIKHHLAYTGNKSGIFRFISDLAFYLRRGISLAKKNGPYDVICAYGLTKTAIAALVLSKLTHSRLVIEVAANPALAFIADVMKPSSALLLKYAIYRKLARFILTRAACVRILYPQQLDGLDLNRSVKTSCFHEFAAVSAMPKNLPAEDYIVFLGFPWYLKGVDVLIKTFDIISPKHPGLRLKIVGYATDQSYFRALAGTNARIEFCDAVPPLEAADLVARSRILVLPSRTEAMGRVLLEAMAAGRPVIGSRVDGIPYYISHEKTGLLFTSENVEDLANCMERLLSDSALYERLASGGCDYVLNELNEELYASRYYQMLNMAVGEKASQQL